VDILYIKRFFLLRHTKDSRYVARCRCLRFYVYEYRNWWYSS